MSFKELARRAGETAVFLISGVAAVVVLFIEHVWPKNHIADGLGSGSSSLGSPEASLAFHWVRLERDQGSGEPAPPRHAEQLRMELQSLALALENERAWEAHDAITAHFGALMPALAEWNGRVDRVGAAREALTTALAKEATGLGITAAGYERAFVLAQVGQLVVEGAARGQLDEPPPSFAWAHVSDGTVMQIEIAHQQPPVAMIPDPGGTLVQAPELTKHITDPVDKLSLTRVDVARGAGARQRAKRPPRLPRHVLADGRSPQPGRANPCRSRLPGLPAQPRRLTQHQRLAEGVVEQMHVNRQREPKASSTRARRCTWTAFRPDANSREAHEAFALLGVEDDRAAFGAGDPARRAAGRDRDAEGARKEAAAVTAVFCEHGHQSIGGDLLESQGTGRTGCLEQRCGVELSCGRGHARPRVSASPGWSRLGIVAATSRLTA